jgi:WD40 repeat protein/serine/threonine protein kinase
MVVAPGCPDPAVLEQLALGRLAPEEVERLADHCEHCPRCVQALQRLRAEDNLVEAMRSQAAAGGTPLPESVRRLMQGLKRLRPAGGRPVPTEEGTTRSGAGPASSGDTPTEPAPPEHAPELYDFLAPAQGPGELGRLGGYRVLKVLGAGGMGVVFLAEDPELKRLVALKAMMPALAASTTARQRFLREAQAMAAVQHDHVVHINQIGQHGDIPFLAMPYLDGETLEDRLEREGLLPPAEVVRIGREIAEGLAAAHAKGLIHRDVKPANVWLEGERGRVKILDFGLARVATGDRARLTQTGAVAGTPAYMSPEQGRGGAIDHRSDLFSLGSVLYRLATGAVPFHGTDPISTLVAVATDQPAPPCERNPAVSPALSGLIERLLAKKPEGRPASAREVAEALRAIETALVPARPVAPPTHTSEPRTPSVRGAGRHIPALAAVLLLALLPLSYFFGGTVIRFATNKGVLAIETDDPDIEVTIKGGSATIYDKVKDRRFVLTAGDYEVQVREEGDGGIRFATKKFTITRGGKETLNARVELANVGPTTSGPAAPAEPVSQPPPAKAAPGVKNPECPLDYLDPAAIPAAERRPWHPPELVAVLGNSGMRLGTLSLAFSPDNTLVAAGGEQERSVKVWEVATAREVMLLGDFPGWVTGVAFSPDGKLLYAGSGDEIRVVDFATKKTLHTWRGQRGGLAEMALSRDGKLLAAGAGWSDKNTPGMGLELWDTTTGQKLHSAEGNFPAVAFSPDGKSLAVGGPKPGLWDVAAWKERQPLAAHKYVMGVAFSRDGRFLATAGGTDTTVGVWDAVTGKPIQTINCQQGNLNRVAFQANGQVLATGGDNVKLWETATGQEVRTLGPSGDALAMTPDGQTLATGAGDGVRLWECATGRELFPRTGIQEVGVAAVSPDGTTVATGGATIRLWDARTAKVRQSLILHRRGVGGVAFSPDGKTLASGSGDGTVRLWDAATGDERQTFTGVPGGAGQVAFSRDGRLLAASVMGDTTDNAKVWDLTTGQLRHTLKGRNDPGARGFLRGVAFSPTEPLLATCATSTIFLWDSATAQKFGELNFPVQDHEVTGMAFSPDGRRLAACYFHDVLKLWDVKTRKELQTLKGHGESLSGVAWSPDGKLLASAGADGTVRLWDGETGAAGKVFRMHSPSGHLGGLTFSPEGRHLLVNSGQGTAYVLRLRPPGGAPEAAAPARPAADADR